MSTEENKASRPFVCYCATKLSTRKIFSFSEGITNALQLIEFMGFMMNVKEDTKLSSGEYSPTASNASQ
jgi:hypothetical protein